MIDSGSMNISDEMFASYLDGNSTPLENIIIGEAISDESLMEISELAADCSNPDLMDKVEPLPIDDIIDDFIKPFKDYQELKSDLDTPIDNNVM